MRPPEPPQSQPHKRASSPGVVSPGTEGRWLRLGLWRGGTLALLYPQAFMLAHTGPGTTGLLSVARDDV